MSETIDGWEVVAIEPGLWCLRRPGYSAEIQASADGDNIDIADDAGRRWLYPPVAAIERLLALRRAALAPEAHAPSGEPWRPTVGERCFFFASGEWRLAERIEDEYNGVRRYRSLTASHAAVTWFEVPEYDGIRPLGSLPMPPSCGGEPEPRERGGRPAVASERPGLARLLEWARKAEANEEEFRRTSRVPEGAEHYETRKEAFEECVREIEREIAALGPPSIAEDLRAPEPGVFEGAQLIGTDGHEVSLRSALAKEIEVLMGQWDNDDLTEEAQENDWTLAEFLGDGLASRIEPAVIQREVRSAAVRDALADLREWARRADREAETTAREATTNLSVIRHQGRQEGYRDALDALDRLAERFKP